MFRNSQLEDESPLVWANPAAKWPSLSWQVQYSGFSDASLSSLGISAASLSNSTLCQCVRIWTWCAQRLYRSFCSDNLTSSHCSKWSYLSVLRWAHKILKYHPCLSKSRFAFVSARCTLFLHGFHVNVIPWVTPISCFQRHAHGNANVALLYCWA